MGIPTGQFLPGQLSLKAGQVDLLAVTATVARAIERSDVGSKRGDSRSRGRLVPITPNSPYRLRQRVPAQLTHTLACQVPHFTFLALREPSVQYEERERDVQVKINRKTEKAEREMTSDRGLEGSITVYLVEKE